MTSKTASPCGDTTTEQLRKIQDLLTDNTVLSGNEGFASHVSFLTHHRELYIAELLLQLHTVDVPRGVKVAAALAAFELRDEPLIRCLLSDLDNFSLPEVLSLCHHLDADRCRRSLEAKIRQMRTPEIIGFEKTPPPRPARREAIKPMPKLAPRSASRGRGRMVAPKIDWKAEKEARAEVIRQRQEHPGRSDEEKLFRRVMRTIKKIKTLEQEISRRASEKVHGLSATLSGRNCTYFREWAARITEHSLRHFMIEFGSLSMWTELANLVHINPARMSMPTFLNFAHSDQEESDLLHSRLSEDIRYALLLKRRYLPPNVATGSSKKKKSSKPLKGLSLSDDLDEIVKHQVPLTLLRKLQPVKSWPDTLKAAVTEYTDISTVFWWIEEFRCDAVERQLTLRLSKGDLPKFGYGKLMERLMWCNGARSKLLPPLVPYAESCLQDYTLPLRTPMAVLGDCSGSMQVAVRTASIIVSLLTALGQAELHFFSDKLVDPPFVPATIREAIICSDEVKADGATSPAAALEPLCFNRKQMETLVVVTDEQENDPGPKSKKLFHELYEQYRTEVSPGCFLVLVSFLGPSEEGQMATELTKRGIPFLQCRLSRERPDLTKLDMLLGKLSMETTLHKIAAQCCATFLATKPTAEVAAREVKKFTRSFVREGTGGIVRFIKTMVNNLDEDPTHFDALKQLLLTFFTTLQNTDFVTAAISRITDSKDVSDLQNWCESEWSTNWTDEVAQNTFSARPLKFEKKPCGSLTRVPREVMEIALSWLPSKQLKEMELSGSSVLPVLCTVARDMKFFAKFHEEKGEWDDAIEQIRNMGLLEMFSEEDCIKRLKEARGNVEHAITRLFNDDDDQEPRRQARVAARGW